MPIGYSQITQINAYENDSFDFIVNTQLMFPEELGGYKIRLCKVDGAWKLW